MITGTTQSLSLAETMGQSHPDLLPANCSDVAHQGEFGCEPSGVVPCPLAGGLCVVVWCSHRTRCINLKGVGGLEQRGLHAVHDETHGWTLAHIYI